MLLAGDACVLAMSAIHLVDFINTFPFCIIVSGISSTGKDTVCLFYLNVLIKVQ